MNEAIKVIGADLSVHLCQAIQGSAEASGIDSAAISATVKQLLGV